MDTKIRTPACEKINQIFGILSSRRVFGIILLLFIITSYLINNRPFGMAQFRDITGGAGIPDLAFFYHPSSLYPLLDTMGVPGREFFLTRILPADMIFPLLYTLLFTLALRYLILTWIPDKPSWQCLLCIPLLGGLADYGENLCFITLLLHYPVHMDLIPECAAILSAIKWISGFLTFLLIGIAGIGSAIAWMKNRMAVSPP